MSLTTLTSQESDAAWRKVADNFKKSGWTVEKERLANAAADKTIEEYEEKERLRLAEEDRIWRSWNSRWKASLESEEASAEFEKEPLFYKGRLELKTDKMVHLLQGESNGSISHNRSMKTMCGLANQTWDCGYLVVHQRNKENVTCGACRGFDE